MIFVITSGHFAATSACAYPVIVSQMSTISTIVTNEVQTFLLNELEGTKDTALLTSTILRRKNVKHLPEGDDRVLINTARKFGIDYLYYGALMEHFMVVGQSIITPSSLLQIHHQHRAGSSLMEYKA